MFDLKKNGIVPIMPEQFNDIDFEVIELEGERLLSRRDVPAYHEGEYSWCSTPRPLLTTEELNGVQYNVVGLSNSLGLIAIDMKSYATVTEDTVTDGVAVILGLK